MWPGAGCFWEPLLSPFSAHRDMPAGAPGAAEEPEKRKGRLDGDVDGKKAPEGQAMASSSETPDQLAPGPGSGRPAPGAPRELVPSGAAQGSPRPPAPTSSESPQSSAPAPPPKAPEPVPSGDSSGSLGPHTPGHQGLHHPAKPPRSKAPKGPGQEPRSPPSAPLSPSLAEASPGSPRGATVGHPERPRPADRKPCPPSVDASPAPRSPACPSLQEATRLIREEFAFDGYLDHGLEALIMGAGARGAPCSGAGRHEGLQLPQRGSHSPAAGGRTGAPRVVWQSPAARLPHSETSRAAEESGGPPAQLTHVVICPSPLAPPGEYIYALKDLTYATFCGAIAEKFCDLYWGEKLLQNLFHVVNGRTSPPTR